MISNRTLIRLLIQTDTSMAISWYPVEGSLVTSRCPGEQVFVTDTAAANVGFCKLGERNKRRRRQRDKEPFAAAWLAILILSLQTDNTTHNATTRLSTRTRAAPRSTKNVMDDLQVRMNSRIKFLQI